MIKTEKIILVVSRFKTNFLLLMKYNGAVWLSFYVKDQILNILGFEDHRVSTETI